MVVRASSANPQVLRWARLRAGMSIEAAAKAIGREAQALEAWESGSQSPTYRQLADLAQRVYKRPVAVFFFPAPPEEEQIASDFRTLPDAQRDELEPDTLFALREARAWQLSAPEILQGIEQPFRGTVADIRALPRESPIALAKRVREVLGVSVPQQLKWRTSEEALKAWRSAVEELGILVFKRPFKQESISGFCLDDAAHPVIVLNNSTAHTRQIFTLIHELGHLAFGISGVTTRDDDDLGSLAPVERRLEIACNQFAATALFPPDAVVLDRILAASDLESAITRTARDFHVSREVVLRRLLDARRIGADVYSELVTRWREDYFRKDEPTGGGSYYANVGTYLSDTYARAVLYQYHAGRLGIGEAAEHLRIKAQNVERFEAFLLSRGTPE